MRILECPLHPQGIASSCASRPTMSADTRRLRPAKPYLPSLVEDLPPNFVAIWASSSELKRAAESAESVRDPTPPRRQVTVARSIDRQTKSFPKPAARKKSAPLNPAALFARHNRSGGLRRRIRIAAIPGKTLISFHFHQLRRPPRRARSTAFHAVRRHFPCRSL